MENKQPNSIPKKEGKDVVKMVGKEITLPSGKIAKVHPFKGKHILDAQKAAGDDQNKVIYAIIAQLCTIDGQKLVMEDILEMEGPDVLALMGEFGSNFT